jgi:hypothetical protein
MSDSEVYRAGTGPIVTSQLELDIMTVVARLQQLRDEHGEDMKEFLIHRLTSSDLQRLRAHLRPELRAQLDDLFASPERLDRGIQLVEEGHADVR